MAKSAKTQATVVGTTIDALVKEGKALAKIWKQTNSLKDSTKASGFDTRLGKLMQELKAQSTNDKGQISRQVLVAHGIHTIDRRRRSEALWFVENQAECLEFMKASKKGFTSLTALQAAMRKATATTEPAKAEVSNVGQSDDKPAKAEPKMVQHSETKVSVPVTRSVMVNTIIKQCEANGLDLEKVIDDLIDRLNAQEAQVKKEAEMNLTLKKSIG
jgi:hypothetical protein